MPITASEFSGGYELLNDPLVRVDTASVAGKLINPPKASDARPKPSTRQYSEIVIEAFDDEKEALGLLSRRNCRWTSDRYRRDQEKR
jgi:hypothetical protein